jgi:glutamate--cysteine ligase
MRGADTGPASRLCALPALFVGLLYDQASLDTAYEMIKGWTVEERQALRDDVPKQGLQARIRGRTVRDIARDVLALSRSGLVRRHRIDAQGRDETRFLLPIEAYVAEGRCLAEELITKFHEEWGGSVDPVFQDYAY